MTWQEAKRRLQEHRPEILNAELAGHLHVVNRLNERFLTTADSQSKYSIWRVTRPLSIKPEVEAKLAITDEKEFENSLNESEWHQEEKRVARRLRSFIYLNEGLLSSDQEALINRIVVRVLGEEWPLGDIVSLWKGPFTADVTAPVATLLKNSCVSIDPVTGEPTCNSLLLFERSHAAASGQRGTGPEESSGRVSTLEHIASVFGLEQEGKVSWQKSETLDSILSKCQDFVAGRSNFIAHWREMSKACFAYTRRPINDISVWQYGQAVSSFLKAAVAKVWLEEKWPENIATLDWTLLALGYPGLEFIGKAVRITDVLSRKEWIQGRLNSIRNLLEDEVPLGNEIYRDENGAIFLVAKPDELNIKELASNLISEKHSSRQDDLELFIECRYGRNRNGMFPIWEAIQDMRAPQMLPPERIKGWWANCRPAVICPVCGLRPMAEQGRAEERSLCQICFERRQELMRSEKWLSDRETTIWIDEASDENGICALMAGELDLKGWLEQKEEENFFSALVHKRPDFMRVQSCWETTREILEAD